MQQNIKLSRKKAINLLKERVKEELNSDNFDSNEDYINGINQVRNLIANHSENTDFVQKFVEEHSHDVVALKDIKTFLVQQKKNLEQQQNEYVVITSIRFNGENVSNSSFIKNLTSEPIEGYFFSEESYVRAYNNILSLIINFDPTAFSLSSERTKMTKTEAKELLSKEEYLLLEKETK
tara:strand:- start:295 stop:831 length:537 start_codon:yes stop_codon:yes gene_type:complete